MISAVDISGAVWSRMTREWAIIQDGQGQEDEDRRRTGHGGVSYGEEGVN